MGHKKPIKYNDQQLMMMAGNVADLYHQLSNELFDNIIDRLKSRGSHYLYEQPYLWQLEKMADMELLNEANIRTMAEYSGIAEEQIRYIIENEGYQVYEDTYTYLGEKPPGGHVMELLNGYSNQAVSDMDNLINTTLPISVQKVYKSIIEETVGKVVIGIATEDTALDDTIIKWHAKGFYGFTDRGGRWQRADSYARTIIRTTVNRVNNEMRTRPALELGIDTFYYSIKAAARKNCAPIQNKVVTTGSARTEHGIEIHALSDYDYGKPGGCLGINCGHNMIPFIPGANKLPDIDYDLKGLTPEQAMENANIQAKQRALERSIRFTKEQIHVAEKLANEKFHSRFVNKLRRQTTALDDLVDQHDFLYRDSKREEYYNDPLSAAKEEIRQRRKLAKMAKRETN
ncbi:phage minor capsid protein [Streptococcus sp. 10F2]